MPNVNCMIDVVYNMLLDSTSLQNWAVTDSTGISNHVFKYFIEEDYIETVYPQVLVSNGSNSVDFIYDIGFEWNTSVLVQFTDVPSRYLDDSSSEITNISTLLYQFQENVDSIIGDMITNPDLPNTPITSVELVSGPDIASYEIKNQSEGRLLNSLYSFEYKG